MKNITLSTNFISGQQTWQISGISSSSDTSESNSVRTAISTNRDYFELGSSTKNVTYSATSIKTKSTLSTATTDTQRRNIPKSLAAKMAGLSITSSGEPRINGQADAQAYQAAVDIIKGDHENISCSSAYMYSQTEDSYGYTNATSSCATYALATAISIREGTAITPDMISTESSTSGHGTIWGNHGAYAYSASESETLFAIDAQLQLGNPVLIHVEGTSSGGYASEHWATVIGKQDGEYTIVDPYYGNVCSLDEMQIYKNNGSIVGYAIVSNQY